MNKKMVFVNITGEHNNELRDYVNPEFVVALEGGEDWAIVHFKSGDSRRTDNSLKNVLRILKENGAKENQLRPPRDEE